MPEPTDVSGIAALTILESLLLALNDRKVLAECEILGERTMKTCSADIQQYSMPV